MATLPSLVQYQLADGPSGPTKNYWNRKIAGVSWKTAGGDWLDTAKLSHGAAYFARVPVLASTLPAWKAFTITALVQRQLVDNRGIFLRTLGPSAWAVKFAGRTYADASKQPTLTVVTDTGTFICPVRATANVTLSGTNWVEGRQQFGVAQGINGLIQFDMSAVTGNVGTATLNLYAVSLQALQIVNVDVFEIDPPQMILGGGGAAPRLGLAQAYANDAGAEADPRVLFHATFENANSVTRYRDSPHGIWDSGAPGPTGAWSRMLDDALGSWVVRGSFIPGNLYAGSLRRWIVNEVENNNRGHDAGSGKPVYRDPVTKVRLMPTQDANGNWLPPQPTIFMRSYLMLEQDYGDTITSCKGGASIGGQFGSFQAYGGDRVVTSDTGQRGNFTDAFGSGTSSSKAIRGLWQYDNNDSPAVADFYNFQGWSIRGHIDQDMGENTGPGGTGGPLDGNAYNGLFYEFRFYAYDMDGVSNNGDIWHTGRGLSKGQWYCLELEAHVNTISGPLDADGNGTANADGVVKLHIDGVEVFSKTNVRLTRNIWFGVEHLWFDFYHGGTSPVSDVKVQQHFRYGGILAATEYIGPAVLTPIIPPPEPPMPNLPPVITNMTASPSILPAGGGAVVVNATVDQPDAVLVLDGVPIAALPTTVNVAADHVFTLTATQPAVSATATAAVTVAQPLPPPTLPAWAPAANTVLDLTAAGKVANTFASIVKTPNFSGFYSKKIITDYSAQRGNPWFGSFGGLHCVGAGHAASDDNSVMTVEARVADVIWKRLNEPVDFSGLVPPPAKPWDLVDQTNDLPGPPAYNITDSNWGETLQAPGGLPFDPVQPQTFHSYDSLGIIPPANGGAVNGSLLTIVRMALNTKSKPGVTQAAHRMEFANTTEAASFYARACATYAAPDPNGIGSSTAFDPTRNREWLVSNASNPERSIRYFDVATGTYGSIAFRTGALSKNTGGPDSGCTNYDPVHDALIFTASPTATGNLAISFLLCSDPAGGWYRATLSQPIPNATGGQTPFGYVDAQSTSDGVGRWILLSRNSPLNTYYDIVMQAAISDPWIVTPRTLASGTLPKFYICGKLVFLPKCGCFLHTVYNSVDNLVHVSAFRPLGA